MIHPYICLRINLSAATFSLQLVDNIKDILGDEIDVHNVNWRVVTDVERGCSRRRIDGGDVSRSREEWEGIVRRVIADTWARLSKNAQ